MKNLPANRSKLIFQGKDVETLIAVERPDGLIDSFDPSISGLSALELFSRLGYLVEGGPNALYPRIGREHSAADLSPFLVGKTVSFVEDFWLGKNCLTRIEFSDGTGIIAMSNGRIEYDDHSNGIDSAHFTYEEMGYEEPFSQEEQFETESGG